MDRPRTLVLATDHSDCAQRATEAASALARRWDATLHLVHALEVPLPLFEPYAVAMPVEFVEEARKAARERLEQLASDLGRDGVTCSTHLGEVPAAPMIADQAEAVGADWVVVGTHGRSGLKRFALGSVAERTVQLAPCSVLTIKDGASFEPKTIVVGLDFSDASRAALREAASLAKEFGAKLVLVHALDFQIPLMASHEAAIPFDLVEESAEAARKELAKIVDGELAEIAAETLVLRRPAAAALSQIAQERKADLIVTGSRGPLGALASADRQRRRAHASRSAVLGAHDQDGRGVGGCVGAGSSLRRSLQPGRSPASPRPAPRIPLRDRPRGRSRRSGPGCTSSTARAATARRGGATVRSRQRSSPHRPT